MLTFFIESISWLLWPSHKMQSMHIKTFYLKQNAALLFIYLHIFYYAFSITLHYIDFMCYASFEQLRPNFLVRIEFFKQMNLFCIKDN